jgi:hypothetical protein
MEVQSEDKISLPGMRIEERNQKAKGKYQKSKIKEVLSFSTLSNSRPLCGRELDKVEWAG